MAIDTDPTSLLEDTWSAPGTALHGIISTSACTSSNASTLSTAYTALERTYHILRSTESSYPHYDISSVFTNALFQDTLSALTAFPSPFPSELTTTVLTALRAVQALVITHMQRATMLARQHLFSRLNAAQASFKFGCFSLRRNAALDRRTLLAVEQVLKEAADVGAELRWRQQEGEEGLVRWDEESRGYFEEIVGWLRGVDGDLTGELGCLVKRVKNRVRMVWKMLCVAPGQGVKWPL